MPATPAQNSPMQLGDKIERMATLREEKRQLNAQISEINEEYNDLEAAILDELDQQGTRMSGSSRHRVGISEQTVPNVTDWEAVHEWAKNHDALYVFERRLASAPWRELHDGGQLIPGTEPFTRRKISLTKI